MKKKTIILLLAFAGITAALFGLIMASLFLPRPDLPFPIPPETHEMIRLSMLIKTMVSFVNTALIIFLLVMYTNMYRKLRTQFTLGLILVMISFLLYAITSNPLIHLLFGYYGTTLGPFVMLPDMFTTFALVVLIFITLE